MLITLLGLGVVFSVFIFFLSPKLSPIPYFPTLNRDIKLVDRALNLKPNDVLFDLGAGDGKMLWRYARPGVKVIGVEINPYLWLYMFVRRLFHPHRQQIEIRYQNLFQTSLTSATKIYLFVGPYLMERIIKYILKNKQQTLSRIVSYRYDFKTLTGKELAPKGSKLKTIKGEQNVYLWDF
jgi:16S rRNA A1518/A1519 N6-dimethyltransferase RsmA/KsgA/DIM1 with predicted DNA glycosylase/AP lyase activity